MFTVIFMKSFRNCIIHDKENFDRCANNENNRANKITIISSLCTGVTIFIK